jgi:hypothetical protein
MNNEMFGCNPDKFIESVKNSITYKFSGAYMVAMGLMSDAQELIAADAKEQARQTLNLAKYIIGEISDGNLIGTVQR